MNRLRLLCSLGILRWGCDPMVVVIGILAFLLGVGVGGASIIRQVSSGRLVAGGRIYLCKDTGPVVR